MIKPTLFLALALSCLSAIAQQNAITEMGEEVILYEDGTWKFKNDSDEEIYSIIETNKKKFKRTDNQTFLLKSQKTDVGFYIDPKLWSFKKAEQNEDAEYEIHHKEKDLYGMIITESFEIPLKNLKQIAIQNARSVAPDLKVVKEEYRTVNGERVLMMELHGTMQGIKFAYFGYYFSNEKGTTQAVCYTSQNLMKTLYVEAEAFLNGMEVVK